MKFDCRNGIGFLIVIEISEEKMPRDKVEPYEVCPACNCVITPLHVTNGKTRVVCGARVHTECPLKTLAAIREKVNRIFFALAEKITAAKEWAKEVLAEIRDINEDSLWRIEKILDKAIGHLKELLATVILYEDKTAEAVIRSVEIRLQSIRCYFFWKYPQTV